jgi:hypothetical protein
MHTIIVRSTHPEDLESLFNTVLSIGTEGIHESTTDTDGRCPEGNSLKDIGSSPDATVDEDFEFRVGPRATGLESGNNLNQVLDTGSSRVELTTTVIRQDNSSQAIVVGH